MLTRGRAWGAAPGGEAIAVSADVANYREVENAAAGSERAFAVFDLIGNHPQGKSLRLGDRLVTSCAVSHHAVKVGDISYPATVGFTIYLDFQPEGIGIHVR